jgi:hypothetical protein
VGPRADLDSVAKRKIPSPTRNRTPITPIVQPVASSLYRLGELRNAYNILVGKPEGTRPLGRIRHRWKYNITLNLKEIGWEGVKWIQLAQDRDHCRVPVLKLRVP